jgi:hypothetical protein
MSKAARRMSTGRVQGGSRGRRAGSRTSSDTRDFGFVLGGWSTARRASQLKWLDRRIKEAERPAALQHLVNAGDERSAALAAELAEHWGLEVPVALEDEKGEG